MLKIRPDWTEAARVCSYINTDHTAIWIMWVSGRLFSRERSVFYSINDVWA